MRIFHAAIETNNSSDVEFTNSELNTFPENKFNIIKSLIMELDDL